MTGERFSSYVRICKRCGKPYRTKYKFSKSCPDCFKPHPYSSRHLSHRFDARKKDMRG